MKIYKILQQSIFKLIFCCISSTSCQFYSKEIPTGFPIKLENVYINTQYDHASIANVLILPVANPWLNKQVDRYKIDIAQSIARNFGKFQYFNTYYPTDIASSIKNVIDVDIGTFNRIQMGELGQQFHAQVVLQVSLSDFKTYPPMKSHVKALLIDVNTGEKIWSVDQVFDTSDAKIINGMRIWWNTYRAGGAPQERFDANLQSPRFFIDFVFHSIAQSYGDARIKETNSIKKVAKAKPNY